MEEAGDKDAVQSLPEDCKASRKKDKGVASLRLLPEKSNLELHDAVSTGVVKGYAKKCCNKACE